MKRRKLGNSVLEVAPLGFGGNVFGWTVDEPTAFTLLDAFVDAGLNFIDTADVYSKWAPGNQGGESETIIGNWLKRSGNREKIILATKVGMEMGPNDKGLSKAYILRSAEASLRRLQTDYIDLYFSHVDDQETALDETLEAHTQLIKQGKVKVIGASNYSADRLVEALQVSRRHGYGSYQCLQPRYNLYDRAGYEAKLEDVCLENGLGVVTYFSLASGFLTGKYRSQADLAGKARGQGVKRYLDKRGSRILDTLDAVAREHHATPAQVALAWIIARPSVTAPIASATNRGQLKDLVAATALELESPALERLNQASA